MNPKQFLTWGGIVLLIVAILGAVGVIGPTAEASIFGAPWWFDMYENWAHGVLGIVALIAAFALPVSLQKPLVIVVGVLALLFMLYSGLVSENFYGAMLQNPADTLLHLVVGVWALWAALRKESMPLAV